MDGLLGLLESLAVFQEGSGQPDREWSDMAKMAFDILLTCASAAECGSRTDPELCAMAAAKLHALVQTRRESSGEENAYLIYRVSDIIADSVIPATAADEDDDDRRYSLLAPVMRALLEKSRDQLHLTTQLPTLNLPSAQATGPAFYEAFKTYHSGEEWRYFVDKKVLPTMSIKLSHLFIEI